MTDSPTPKHSEHGEPPVPGAEWCNSCSGWCVPPGICRCNNR
ncbi:hypothetical protein SRB5_15450 [Streptomyces sp. RB5]|uniref:Uncharacterized protein n=1 Tax=Streptomyces smaragdinus TaxID=2585196 RepID=A0A7K0CD76_9ACTN|nr:hypothetical protein [Streptomyces smaragdinus]MQY11427.1 hypothetical protein [Streptomyces smaragdinus]